MPSGTTSPPTSCLAQRLVLMIVSGQFIAALGGMCHGEPGSCSPEASISQSGADTSTLLQVRRVHIDADSEEDSWVEPNPPDWPSSVHVFSEATPRSQMEAAIADAWDTNGKQPPVGEPHGQFSSKRYAFLFKPGTYSVDVPVGYYTQVLGLGSSPDDVVFSQSKGPHVPCNYRPHHPGQLDTFWRSAENFKKTESTVWAVSQAAPIRRVHIGQNLSFTENGCWCSGGYLGNSVVDGIVSGGGQQQWFTRSTKVGSWEGIGWNAVFAGVDVDGPQCDLRENACGTAPFGPKQTVVADEVPLIAEKPFVSLDPSDETKFVLNVPEVRASSHGPDWSVGKTYSFKKVYVTKPTDSSATINAKLQKGLHVVVTPAVYALDQPLRITHSNQTLLCLGLATLQSANGNAVVEVGAGISGVRIAGCLLEAGPKATDVLLQWGGNSKQSSSFAPSFLYDVFVRVGGPTKYAAANTMVRIDSDNVIGDNLWLWRADHYDSGNYIVPIQDNRTVLGELPCDHGLVVTGNDVVMYGLFVEHAVKDQVIWSGERGATYFFQCEVPYDVTPAYAEEGYVAYRVDDSVSKHTLLGAGVYSFFRDYEVWMQTAISTPVQVQSSVVQPFVVFLDGHGGINSTINGEGLGVGDLGGFQMAFLNNSCAADCSPAF